MNIQSAIGYSMKSGLSVVNFSINFYDLKLQRILYNIILDSSIIRRQCFYANNLSSTILLSLLLRIYLYQWLTKQQKIFITHKWIICSFENKFSYCFCVYISVPFFQALIVKRNRPWGIQRFGIIQPRALKSIKLN